MAKNALLADFMRRWFFIWLIIWFK